MKSLMAMVAAGGMMLAAMAPAAAAAERGINGLILGAGGGAVLGQAIGRDTEGTLIGTAVGGVLGYVIGNEMDKESLRTVAAGPSRTVVLQPRHDRAWKEPCRHEEQPRHRHRRGGECRETEILAMVNGRPEAVVTTACLEDGEWVLAGGDRHTLNQVVLVRNDHQRHYRKIGPPGRKERHLRGPYWR